MEAKPPPPAGSRGRASPGQGVQAASSSTPDSQGLNLKPPEAKGFLAISGVARNWSWGVYVLTSHCNFKTCVNVPHVNKTVTDFGGIYTDMPPVTTPLLAKFSPFSRICCLGEFARYKCLYYYYYFVSHTADLAPSILR